MKNPTLSSFGAKRRFEAQQRMLNKLSLPLTRFTVNRDSESDCENCGFPLDSGDTAFLAECNEREAVLVFCSRACNRKDLESHRLSA